MTERNFVLNLFQGLDLESFFIAIISFTLVGFVVVSALRTIYWALIKLIEIFIWNNFAVSFIVYFVLGYALLVVFINLLNEGMWFVDYI